MNHDRGGRSSRSIAPARNPPTTGYQCVPNTSSGSRASAVCTVRCVTTTQRRGRCERGPYRTSSHWTPKMPVITRVADSSMWDGPVSACFSSRVCSISARYMPVMTRANRGVRPARPPFPAGSPRRRADPSRADPFLRATFTGPPTPSFRMMKRQSHAIKGQFGLNAFVAEGPGAPRPRGRGAAGAGRVRRDGRRRPRPPGRTGAAPRARRRPASGTPCTGGRRPCGG